MTSRELWIVSLLVRFEYRGSGESLATQRAPERPFAGMHATVILHMVPEFKRFATKLALERPVAGVRGQVAHQGGHVRKRFATKLTQRAASAVVHRGRIAVAAVVRLRRQQRQR